MNKYQRALLLVGGVGIAFIQITWINSEGLSDSKGWAGAFLIAIGLIFLGLTPNETFGKFIQQIRNSVESPKPQKSARPATSEALGYQELRHKMAPEVESSDPLHSAFIDHILFAEQQNLFHRLEGSGRSLKWCCAILLYGAARKVARDDDMEIHAMVWNSLVHRFVVEMLEDSGFGMGDDGYEKLASEAYEELRTIERLVDESIGQSSAKVVGFLSLAFGCAFKPAQAATMARYFEHSVVRARSQYLPHFLQAFE